MNIFDIIGPVMIGPSSSHTAGAVRIGAISRLILGEEPVRADILLHGSFARTYTGHGTDRALAAGILGMAADNESIRNALHIAKERGLEIRFTAGEITDAHPNTAHISLVGKKGNKVQVCGSSIGGGSIRITQVNGRNVSFSGEYPALLVIYDDVPGMLSAITAVVARYAVNIYTINVGRDTRGGTAIACLEMDGEALPESGKQEIEGLTHVHSCTILSAQQ